MSITKERKQTPYAINSWESGIKKAKKFYKKHGHLKLPESYQDKDGFRLGRWLRRRKESYAAGKLPKEQFEQLTKLGIDWTLEKREDVVAALFKNGFTHAKEHFETHGNLIVKEAYIAPDGFRLGGWLAKQKNRRRHGAISPAEIMSLERIGMVWNQHTQEHIRNNRITFLGEERRHE